MANDSQKNQASAGDQSGYPCRTLFIGVGGTGKDILLRVRRWIYERERQTQLPFVRFLYLDTDILGHSLADQGDVISEKIGFKTSEQVPLNMSVEEIKSYFDGTGQSIPAAGVKGVQSWLPKEVSHLIRSLGDGAGQIRAFGRLAFWHHAQDFKARAEQAIHQLTQQEPVDPETGKTAGQMGWQGVHPNLVRVVIVTSVAGGTGSGCFMDVACFVRKLLQGIRMNVHIRAIVVLPSVFHAMNLGSTANSKVLDSNGYAAMKEMDYLLHPPVPRKDGKNVPPELLYFDRANLTVEVQRPIFENVWLVDSATVEGTNLGNPQEPFNVVSDALALELDRSMFAVQMRTEFSNMNQKLGGLKEVAIESGGRLLASLPLHVRYSGVGQASMVLDRDRLRNAAAFRLGQKIVRFMIGDDHDVQRHGESVERALDGVGLSVDGLWKHLLKWTDNQTMLEWWGEQIKLEIKPIEDEIVAVAQNVGSDPSRAMTDLQQRLQTAHNRYRDLSGKIKTRLFDRFDDKSPGLLSDRGTSDLWGEHYSRIHRVNGPKLRDAIHSGVEATFAKFLTNPIELGTPAVSLLLERAASRIESLDREFAGDLPQPEEPKVPEIGEGEAIWTAKLRRDEALLIPSFCYPFRKLAEDVVDNELRSAVQHELTDINKVVRSYLDAWRNCLTVQIRGAYSRHVHPQAKAELEHLKGWFGEQQEVQSQGGQKKSTNMLGLRPRLDNYLSRMRVLEESQRCMADAFLATKRATRHIYFDSTLLEEDLLFDKCLGVTGGSKERIEAIKDQIPRFFAHAKLLSAKTEQAVEQGLDSVKIDALSEGMKAIIERAEKADKRLDLWEQVQLALELFCFERTDRLANEPDLDAAYELLKHSPAEQHDKVRMLKEHSHPLLRLSPNWVSEGISAESRTLVGTAQGYRSKVGQLMAQAGVITDPFESPTGSLVVYQDVWAVPVVLLDTVLEGLKASYDQHLLDSASNCFLRHSDRCWDRFPDIVVPHDQQYWINKRDALQLLFRAILVGLIGYSVDMEQWVIDVVYSGRPRRIPVGVSLASALESLTKHHDGETIAGLRSRVAEQIEKIVVPRTQRLDAYAAAVENLLDVFPPDDRKTKGNPDRRVHTVEGIVAVDMREDVVCGHFARSHDHAPLSRNDQIPPELKAHLDRAVELGLLVEIPYDDPTIATRLKAVGPSPTSDRSSRG